MTFQPSFRLCLSLDIFPRDLAGSLFLKTSAFLSCLQIHMKRCAKMCPAGPEEKLQKDFSQEFKKQPICGPMVPGGEE